MKKRGDTLVEVALAVGIFSMVAIAVVAVMVSSTSSAQTALETTLAREEIDAQAEALRFIHAEYLADPTSESPYTKLWQTITFINDRNHATDRAIDPNIFGAYLDYPPSTCQEVMDSETFKKYGFIINPRALSVEPSKAYIRYANNKSKFTTASTYPRLIYSSVASPDDTTPDDGLISSTDTELYRAEGIYVIAVADAGIKDVAAGEDAEGYGRVLFGFYDFYIRTCWYGASSDTPSAISTVIRLYNPPAVDNS